MAQMTEETFRKQLKSGEFARVYLLYGEESALVIRYAAQLEAKARPEECPEFNLHRLGADATADQIAEAVETLPMLGGRTCVVVSNYDPDTASASDTKKLEELLADLPDYCTLIFREASVLMNPKKPAKWRAFIKAVAAAGETLELPRRTEADLVRSLGAFAQQRGCTLESAVARELIARCGRDVQLLQNEMEKLCAWTQSGSIGRAQIDAVCITTPDAVGYRMANALTAGDFDSAYRQLDQLLYQREEPVLLLGAIASAYVDLYRARAAADSGVSAVSLAPVFDYRGKDFRLKNAARDARRFTLGQLRDALAALAQTDAAIKGSRTEPRILLEKLMAQLMLISAAR